MKLVLGLLGFVAAAFVLIVFGMTTYFVATEGTAYLPGGLAVTNRLPPVGAGQQVNVASATTIGTERMTSYQRGQLITRCFELETVAVTRNDCIARMDKLP